MDADDIFASLTRSHLNRICSITPDPIETSAGGGAGGGAPAPQGGLPVPAASALTPIVRAPVPMAGATPPAPPAIPAPQAPAAQPAPTPAPAAAPATEQAYLTKAEADAYILAQLTKLGIQLPGSAQQAAQQAAAPAAPAPAPAPAAPPIPPAAPQPAPVSQQPAPAQQQAVNPELEALRTQLREQNDRLSKLIGERDEAERRATAVTIESSAVKELQDHPTYRMQEAAAREAVAKMMANQRIAIDPNTKIPWVRIPNAQTGQMDVFSLRDGVARWLETSEGEFFRPRLPPGMGATASSPGHAPASFPQQPNPQPRSDLPASLSEAFQQQQRMNRPPMG